MGLSNKIDTRTFSLVLIALIGGVVGGYISNATMRDTQIEGLSNALTTQLSSKDTEIANLRDELYRLEMQVIDLEFNVVGFTNPDYDSGWLTFNYSDSVFGPLIWVNVQHNLGTTDIYVICLAHERAADYKWSCIDENTIRLDCNKNSLSLCGQPRVLIYRLPPPP
jgi:hypothetical protein